MRRLTLFAAVAVVALPAWPGIAAAQEPVDLHGRVIDEVTGTPIASVAVRIPALQRFTLTDDAGAFRFAGVPPGTYRIVAMGLGFHDQEEEVSVDGETFLTLALPPRPVELEGLVVSSSSFLDGLATRRAHTMRTFWRAFDRDDILRGGTDDPLQFLGGRAGLVIRPCRGLGADRSQLCLLTPTALQRDMGPATGITGRASGNPGAPPGRRNTILEQMRRGSSAHRVWASRVRPGSGWIRVTVYVDDLPLRGSLDELAAFSLRDVERVETYGIRGEHQIRLFTAGYLRLVELGLARPQFEIPAHERYEPIWAWADDRDDRWPPDWPPDRR